MEIVRELTAVDFLDHMEDEDFRELIAMNELPRFCNALTLDIHAIETGQVMAEA